MTGVNRPNPRRPVSPRRPLDYERVPPADAADDEPLWRQTVGRGAMFVLGLMICGVGVLLGLSLWPPLVIAGVVLTLTGLMFVAGAVLPQRWTEPVTNQLGAAGTFLARLLDGCWWWY